MRVVVTGGTGFLGHALVAALAGRGNEAVVVTRDPSRAELPPGARGIGWDGLATAADGADAVVNLAGETIAQRWTAAAKARIVGSRVQAAERVGAALRAAKSPPAVLVNASAVGFYGNRGDEELTEDDVRREQAKVQKHTDEYVAKVEELLKEKEAEVMEI